MENKFEISFGSSTRLHGTHMCEHGTDFAIKESTDRDVFTFTVQKEASLDFSSPVIVSQLPSFSVGMIWYNYGPVFAWMIPRKVSCEEKLFQDKVRFMLLQYSDGVYAAVFPLIGEGYSSEFALVNSELLVNISMDDNLRKESHSIFSIAFGNDPYKTVENAIRLGFIATGKKSVDAQPPDFFKTLGWCSWNAMGHDVSHSMLIQTAHSYMDTNLKPGWFLIDDGWMDISGSYGSGKLVSFRPNADKFPNGLQSAIRELKGHYGIKNVGIWLTMSGYWNGIDPRSELFDRYRNELLPVLYKLPWSDEAEQQIWLPVSAHGAEQTFFMDWFRFLKSEGIDFVKIDHINILSELLNQYPNGHELAKYVLSSIASAVEKVFGRGHAIYCMGMIAEAYVHLGKSGICRISEDYFPHNFSYNPLAGNAVVHAINNFTTGIWIQHIVIPDGDMFQSHHPHASFHAAVRFMMGGAIYMTDEPGKQLGDIYNLLAHPDSRLKRWGKAGVPISRCLFQLFEPLPYIVSVKDGEDFYVGIFNMSDSEMVVGEWSLDEIPGITGDLFKVKSLRKDEMATTDLLGKFSIRLGRMEWDMYHVKLA